VADDSRKNGAVATARRHSRTDREMEYLTERYRAAHPKAAHGPLDPDTVARWGYNEGIWKPAKTDPVDQLRRRLSKHFGRRYMTDPQGREVKELHAVPYTVLTKEGPKRRFKYFPLFTTEPEQIKLAFALRRTWAFNDVVQIETDRLSYNDNNRFGAVIDQMSFNYDTDVAERNMPTTYPDADPGHGDEDDES
jgi:hypothetical protein